MSKQALVDHIVASTGFTQVEASKALAAVGAGLAFVVGIGGTVRLPGLGTFSPKHRPAYTGRNPGTGEAIQIPAKDSVGFKAAKKG